MNTVYPMLLAVTAFAAVATEARSQYIKDGMDILVDGKHFTSVCEDNKNSSPVSISLQTGRHEIKCVNSFILQSYQGAGSILFRTEIVNPVFVTSTSESIIVVNHLFKLFTGKNHAGQVEIFDDHAVDHIVSVICDQRAAVTRVNLSTTQAIWFTGINYSNLMPDKKTMVIAPDKKKQPPQPAGDVAKNALVELVLKN